MAAPCPGVVCWRNTPGRAASASVVSFWMRISSAGIRVIAEATFAELTGRRVAVIGGGYFGVEANFEIDDQSFTAKLASRGVVRASHW